MANRRRGLYALIGSSVAIFWPGAFIFGFPGVMGLLEPVFWSGSRSYRRHHVFCFSRSWPTDVLRR